MTISEQGRYAAQDFPSYGAHPQDCGLSLVFLPWFFDGNTVTWGAPCATHSEALSYARKLASCN